MVGLFVSLIILFSINGAKDAILFSKKGLNAFKWNDHYLFIAERCFWMILILITLISNITQTDFIFLIFSSIFVFPFFYEFFFSFLTIKMENSLVRNPVKALIISSKKEINFSFKQRIFLLGLGSTLFFIGLLWKH